MDKAKIAVIMFVVKKYERCDLYEKLKEIFIGTAYFRNAGITCRV